MNDYLHTIDFTIDIRFSEVLSITILSFIYSRINFGEGFSSGVVCIHIFGTGIGCSLVFILCFYVVSCIRNLCLLVFFRFI